MKPVSLIIFFAVFIGILTPDLFTDGMFLDGTTYAVVSRNLAEGNGTFWNLHFSNTVMSHFIEHPPLAIFLESLSFKLFGDTIYSERLYSLFTAILSAFLMLLIYKQLNENKHEVSPVSILFIWISFPLVNWTYPNNMLENTMTVFILIASLFIFKSFTYKRILMLVLAGFALSAALLSKGLPALYVWSIVFFYFLIFRKINFKRVVFDTSLLVASTAFPIVILFVFSEEAKEMLSSYFNHQVMGSINNVVTVNNRFYILGSLLQQMIIFAVITLILIIVSSVKKIKIRFDSINLKYSLFFLLFSLSGVIPIMISLKQRSFYIFPVLPFLALSLYFFFIDIIKNLRFILNFFKKKFFTLVSLIIAVSVIFLIFIFAGKPGRDVETIKLVHKLAEVIPEETTVTISKNLYKDWALHSYLQRYGKISISDNIESNYFLTADSLKIDSSYQEIKLNLPPYLLFKKKNL
jgi:4-amino-4-deoxy-L-arabinose transferase-like glycosyltransferase